MGRFAFLAREQNPLLSALRYILESVKTYILTDVTQSLQKEVELRGDAEQAERVTFHSQVVRLYLFGE